MNTVLLKFETAKNGWLPLQLEVNGEEVSFDLSYLPNDFLRELVEALDSSLSIEGRHVAVLPEEPAETEWRFHRVQGSVVFSIEQHPDGLNRGRRATKLLEFWGSPLEVVVPLWRGIQELSSRRVKESFKQNWAHEFPTKQLGKLKERIEKLEASV